MDAVVGLSSFWRVLGKGSVAVLGAALVGALLMGSPPPAGAVAGYGDVAEATWYTDAVQWSQDNGITDVAGVCFGPDTPVSRGETAVWIYNMENQPDAGEPHSFTDVTDESQDDAVSWMANNEITTGTTPTTFAPDDTLRRAQVAAFLHRLKGEPSAPPHNFSDVVAGWQQDPVSWMANTGITTGTTPTTFAPEDTLTRAQLVTFLYRYKGEPAVTVDSNSPTCDPNAATYQTVSAGSWGSCGIRADDTINCWGDNPSGGQIYEPVGSFKTVSVGGLHSCGIRADDTAVCWAFDYLGGVFGQADAPTGSFKTVSAGGSHSCGIRADDTIACWGSNDYGEADAPAGSFKTVSAGGDHSCGIRADDTIACWGSNDYGEADAPAGSFKTVSAGGDHSCGIRADDTIACWGSNDDGEADAPTGSFKTLNVSYVHSCGIRADDTIACWGSNDYGEADAPAGSFKTVSAGGDHSCGIRADDTAACWGNNDRGQTEANLKTVSAGSGFRCGIRADDTIACWGYNNLYGQSDAPVGSFKTLSLGYDHSCGIRADDTIICWGSNEYGQTDAPAGSFKTLSVGYFDPGHSCAVACRRHRRLLGQQLIWGD